MCLIVFSYRTHPKYKLIVAANRDEFYGRPTREVQFWENYPHLLAGQDIQAGGTWMGVSKNGRFGALTNYRDLSNLKENPPSRGELVTNYLAKQADLEDYLEGIQQKSPEYNGFNLLLSDKESMYHFSNETMEYSLIEPGIHGVSNALLNTPWTKLERAKNELKDATSSTDVDKEALFALLTDGRPAPDNELPETGLDYKREKMVSSIFIKSENYGTKCSTLLLIDYDGNLEYTERRFDKDQNKVLGTSAFEFKIEN